MNFPGWKQHEGVTNVFSCGLSLTTEGCLYLASTPTHKEWGQTFPLHFKYSTFCPNVAKKKLKKRRCEFQFLLGGKLSTAWHLYAWMEMSGWQNAARQFGNLTRWFMKVHRSVSHTGRPHRRRLGRGLPGGRDANTKTEQSWYKGALLVKDKDSIKEGPHSPDKDPVTFIKLKNYKQKPAYMDANCQRDGRNTIKLIILPQSNGA